MPVYIALLRGVNLVSHNRIKMDVLRSVCESIKLRDVQTYIQSGNIVFRTKETNTAKLAARIEARHRSRIRVPSASNSAHHIAMEGGHRAQPFAARSGIEPGRLLVHFLAGDPGHEAREKVRAIPPAPEELHIFERELYIHFPNGMARPKLSMPAIERALKVTGSGRNWNSVLKLLEMAERLESAE